MLPEKRAALATYLGFLFATAIVVSFRWRTDDATLSANIATAFRRSAPQDSLTFKVFNPDYGSDEPASLAFYPWDHVAEPFRVSKLAVVCHARRSTRKYAWRVDLDGKTLWRATGSQTQFNFTRVGARYQVELASTTWPWRRRTFKNTVICKYLRREIRALTEQNREAYLRAMEVVAHTSLDEGRARFGPEFVNLQYETTKHVHGPGCSPFHGGLSPPPASMLADAAELAAQVYNVPSGLYVRARPCVATRRRDRPHAILGVSVYMSR